MKLDINPEVADLLGFMQSRYPASRLVAMSEAVSILAPVLWGKYRGETIDPVVLVPTTLPVETELEVSNR